MSDGNLFLALLTEIKRLGNHFERFLRATRSRNDNCSVIPGSSDKALVDSDALNLGQHNFYRAATQNANLYEDPFVCYGKFR